MKWVTREKAKVDRIACPWLIKKFVDKNPEFLFVPPENIPQVVKETGAIPYAPPESAGLEAIAHGFRNLAKDDFDNMRLQFPTYDALYKYCQLQVEGTQKLEYNVSQPSR